MLAWLFLASLFPCVPPGRIPLDRLDQCRNYNLLPLCKPASASLTEHQSWDATTCWQHFQRAIVRCTGF